MDFTRSIYDITKTKEYHLRQPLKDQLVSFLEQVHQSQLTTLLSTMDAEQWKNVAVTHRRRENISNLITKNIIPERLSTDTPFEENEATAPSRRITIHQEDYRVVWSLLYLVECITNYLVFIDMFRAVTTEGAKHILDILRVRLMLFRVYC